MMTQRLFNKLWDQAQADPASTSLPDDVVNTYKDLLAKKGNAG